MVWLTNQDAHMCLLTQEYSGIFRNNQEYSGISPWSGWPIRIFYLNFTWYDWPIRILYLNFTMVWLTNQDAHMYLLTNQKCMGPFWLTNQRAGSVCAPIDLPIRIFWVISPCKDIKGSHICWYVSLTVDLSVWLLICQSDCWSVSLTVDLSVWLLICQSDYWSVRLSVVTSVLL